MTATRAGPDAASLLTAVRGRDSLAIARAITAIENRSALGTELAVAVRGRANSCRSLGVTGPPGAGKSSLINALLPELLPRYRRVAILTVDPSSPISGGAEGATNAACRVVVTSGGFEPPTNSLEGCCSIP